jgi:UDP-N-acetylglucosamine:LPS N-acetylglucosamine transferase
MSRLFVVSGRDAKSMAGRSIASSDVVLAADAVSEAVLKSAGTDFKPLDGYGKRILDCEKEATGLLRKWGSQRTGNATIEEMFSYNGMPFWRILESYTAAVVSKMDILNILNSVKSAVRAHEPDCIVCGMGSVAGKVGALVAASLGIKHEGIGPGFARRAEAFKKRYGFEYPYRYVAGALRLKRRRLGAVGGFPPDSKTRILIIPSIQTNLPVIKPVIEELRKDPNNDLLVLRYDLFRSRMKTDMKRMGIRHVDMDTYATKDSGRAAKKMEMYLKCAWKGVGKANKSRAVFVYNDVSLWGLMEDVFAYFFSGRSRITEITNYIETMRNVLKKERPDVIVTLDESSCTGMPTMIMAREAGIPTLGIQHSAILKHVGPAVVDKMAVWGESKKKDMTDRGFDPKKIVVTGCPKNDMITNRHYDENAFRERFHVPPGKGIILFASQPNSANKSYLKVLYSAVKEFPEKQLVVKAHPMETSTSIYHKVAKDVDIDVLVVDKDLYEPLDACELLITRRSMVGMEAALVGKPVIIFNPIDKADVMSYVEKGIALGVYEPNPDKLAEAIDSVLYSKKTQKKLADAARVFIPQVAYRMDGKSSERVAKLVKSLVKERENDIKGASNL